MSEEETKKMFSRIELDKASDSCRFEFADGYGCTFDNIATCYDDRLKLYDFVKQLQQQNQKYKEVIDKAIELLGNYRHYSMPDEKQNSDNEDLVNNAFDILKEAE